jgi:hypothetical protein
MSKIPSTDLYDLIRSLSGSEKRYFKVFSERHTIGERNNYLLLFDELAGLKQYDEAKLLSTGSPAIKDHFADQKQKLYAQVLRSSVNFHYRSTLDLELFHQLSAAHLLFRKTLFLQCRKLIDKVLKKALYYERFPIALECLGWKRQLVFTSFDLKRSKKELAALNAETDRVTRLHSNAIEYRKLSEGLYLILSEDSFLRSKRNREAAKKLKSTKLFREPRLALSIDARMSFHRANGFYCYMTDDPKGFYEHNLEMLGLVRSYQHLAGNPLRSQVTAYQNILIGLKNMGRITRAKEMLEEFRALTAEFPDQRSEIFAIATDIELTLYIDTGNFEEGSLLEARIRPELEKQASVINPSTFAIICFNMAYLLIGSEKFRAAEKWLNRIVYEKQGSPPPDTFAMAKLLLMLVYFERNDTDRLEYCLKPTSNYLEKNEQFFLLEKALVAFFTLMIDPDERKKRKEHYDTLYAQLLAVNKDAGQRAAFNYFNFLAWARGKKEGMGMEEMVKEERK